MARRIRRRGASRRRSLVRCFDSAATTCDDGLKQLLWRIDVPGFPGVGGIVDNLDGDWHFREVVSSVTLIRGRQFRM